MTFFHDTLSSATASLSACSRAVTSSFSSDVTKVAFDGQSMTYHHAATARTTVRMPSMMKIHLFGCQCFETSPRWPDVGYVRTSSHSILPILSCAQCPMPKCHRMHQRETRPRRKGQHDTGAQSVCTTASLHVSQVIFHCKKLDTHHRQVEYDTRKESA